ncbi:MAG TPA: sel1 repeat family protein [Epsilonproteobacteria bacterium]|nr:sel1 repeat family protein [Campylobacterota bacterium]
MKRIVSRIALLLPLLPMLASAQINVADLQKRAANKDSYALYQLGYLYENGQGVSADANKAKAYYRQAAALGNSDAAFALDLMSEFESKKVTKVTTHSNKVTLEETSAVMLGADKKNIEKLMKQAASGDVKAEFQLGLAYDNGYGVKRDMKHALKWYKRAAEHGSKQAAEVLQIIRTKK